MALTFRWNGSVPGYSWLGVLIRKLTALEIDANFGTLWAECLELRAAIESGMAIDDIAVDDPIVPTMFIITLADYRTFEIPLPVATFNPREIPWSNNLHLNRLDLFEVADFGQYWVRVTHDTPPSPAVFDPDAEDGEGNKLYGIFSTFTNAVTWRGAYAATDYQADDLFTHPSYGLFLVLVSHDATAASEDFDPYAVNDNDESLYAQLAGPPFSPIRDIDDTAYEITLLDVGWYLRFTSDEGCQITFPFGVDFPAGGTVDMRQAGEGPLTFVEDTGFTINPQRQGYDSSTFYQGAVITAKFVSSTECDLIGPFSSVLVS